MGDERKDPERSSAPSYSFWSSTKSKANPKSENAQFDAMMWQARHVAPRPKSERDEYEERRAFFRDLGDGT